MGVSIRNTEDLDVGDIKDQMLEKRPLPIGRTQFEEWSDRIIAGAMVEASTRSLKQSLAHMIMHMGPTEAFREDGYFILQLRMAAVKQTAHMMAEEIKEAFKAEQKLAEDTAPKLEVVDGALLENKGL